MIDYRRSIVLMLGEQNSRYSERTIHPPGQPASQSSIHPSTGKYRRINLLVIRMHMHSPSSNSARWLFSTTLDQYLQWWSRSDIEFLVYIYWILCGLFRSVSNVRFGEGPGWNLSATVIGNCATLYYQSLYVRRDAYKQILRTRNVSYTFWNVPLLNKYFSPTF